MHRAKIFVSVCVPLLLMASDSRAQTPISRYSFDGNLLNASTFVDTNMVEAPDGTFREGADWATAVVGTATFARGVDGTAGGALVLDGIDDWIDVTTAGHPGRPIPAGSFSGPGLLSGTAMAWVRVEPSILDEAAWLMGNTNAANFQSWQMGWNGEQLMARPAAAGNEAHQFVILDESNNAAWADGEWHHLAFTWDGVIEDAQIYVDGAPQGTVDTNPNLTFGAVQADWQLPMAIGARNNGGTLEGFWKGLVDDLRIYAEQLSDAQILSIFNATVIAPDPDPADADFDGDGDADGADFLIWQRGVGSGATFAEGDANEDEVVDGEDLAIWKDVFGAPPAATLATAPVPEPGSVALFALGVAGLISMRRAQRRNR